MPDAQGTLMDDPCGGTGLIVFERTTNTPHPFLDGERIVRTSTMTARCLCHKGQHLLSPAIPLICDAVETTEQLQDLFPHGVPEITSRTPTSPMQTSARCRCGHPSSTHTDDGFCKRCPCMVFRATDAR